MDLLARESRQAPVQPREKPGRPMPMAFRACRDSLKPVCPFPGDDGR